MAAISPKYKLRVAWDATSDLAQTGADITSRTIDRMECWLGRDGSSNVVNRSNAGGLVAMLNNVSGDYSPNNESGPLFGNLSPKGQRVRLTTFGQAAQFPGTDEYLSGGDVLDITTQDFSIMIWLQNDSLGQYGLMNKRDRASATNLGYAVEAQSDGTIDAFISDGTSVTTISSTTTSSAGEWVLAIITFDRSGNAQVYIDNGSAEGATDITSQNGTLANSIPFQLGAGYSGSADRFFGGRFAPVAIWDKLLTSAERTFLWRDGDGVRYRDIGLTGDGSTLTTNLLAWYDMQETVDDNILLLEDGDAFLLEDGDFLQLETLVREDSHNSNDLDDINGVIDAEGIPNYSLWKGFLQNIEPLPGLTVNRARLVAVGSLGQVNLNKLRLLNVENEVTGTAIGRILDEANWPTDDRTVDTGKTTMTNFWLENEIRTLSALRRIERTETGYIGESKDGRIVFEDRRHRQTSPFNTSQVTFTDSLGAIFNYSPPLRQLDSQQQLFHKFPVSVPTYTNVSLAILWTLAASGADSPAINPGETISFFANYPNPSSATNAWLVKAWTTPVENTDYEANSQAGGGGDDKSGQLTVTVDKFANSMKINITNDDSAVVFLTLLQARGTSKTKDDPISITVETAATYPRTFPDPPQYIPNIAEALDWANWHNNVFNTVQPLLQMTFLGNRSAAQFAHALNLTVSDRMTMVAENDTGLGINEDFYIESERHVMDAKLKTHWTTWGLSAAQSQDGWTLNFSKLATETRLVYP